MENLTVIAPAFNEQEVIEIFYNRTREVLNNLVGVNASILFVVDRSNDDTLSILRKIAFADPKVQVLSLSTRYGHQICLMAGIEKSKQSDFLIMMDCDLQHPPKLIPQLIAEYRKGNDVVYTIRSENKSEGLARKFLGNFFYYCIKKISDTTINANAADFRLISRRVALILANDFREKNLFLRGIFPIIGFKQTYIEYKADYRAGGVSKYSFYKSFQLAITGIISVSTKPLYLGIFIGLFLSLSAFLLVLFTIFNYFYDKTIPSGWTTIVALVLLFNGAQFLIIGIIGAYIGNIDREVKNRPRYLIDEEIGFK